MKAKYEPRIDLDNRTALETVIPLSSPFVLFVDPSDACNFKCRFCPTSDRDLMKSVQRPWRQMPLEIFKKIVVDMKQFKQKVRVLRLYKDGEPLLNKNLAEMVSYAKKMDVSDKIDMTTNAALLTRDKGLALVEAGLDRINISIYGVSDKNYADFSGVKIEFAKILENVKSFYDIRGECEMLVKINGDSLSEEEKKLFLEEFGDHTDKIYVESIMSCWPNFKLRGVEVNTSQGIYGQKLQELNVCPYPFYSMAINSDGVVSVCFLDWSRKLTIGDVRVESLIDIWAGEAMKSYQKMFLEGHRKNHPICGDCGQMTHGNADNLDEYREKILEKLVSIKYFNK